VRLFDTFSVTRGQDIDNQFMALGLTAVAVMVDAVSKIVKAKLPGPRSIVSIFVKRRGAR